MTDELPERPRLAARLNLLRLGDGRFLLQSVTESIVLGPEQRLFAELAPLLTGDHDVRGLVAALPERRPGEIVRALHQLRARGLLEAPTEAGQERYRPQLTFFSHLAGGGLGSGADAPARSAADLQRRLGRSRVLLLGLGRLGSNLLRDLVLAGVGRITVADPAAVAAADRAAGAAWRTEDEGRPRVDAAVDAAARWNPEVEVEGLPDTAAAEAALPAADLVVVATDGFSPPFYERVNRLCLEHGTRWTSFRWIGFEIDLGPTVIPGETPCFTCFRGRLRAAAPSDAGFQALEEYLAANPWRAGHPSFVAGAGLAAYEVVNLLSGFDLARTVAHLFTFDLMSFESRLDPVLKLPGCPACGRPARDLPGPTLWEKSPRAE